MNKIKIIICPLSTLCSSRLTKKLFYLIFLFSFLFSINLFSTCLDSLKDWEQTKAQAKQENKLIFIDAYTDWCIWCKHMDKETYADSSVCSFLKNKFVSVKLNCEDSLGIIFAKKYRISSFPSYLVFNSQGKLISKKSGYQKPNKFLNTINDIIKNSSESVYKGVSDELTMQFPDFYNRFFDDTKINHDKRYPPDKQIVRMYLDSQNDLFSEVNWSVIYKFDNDSIYNDFFLKNFEKYVELFGRDEPERKLYRILNAIYRSAINQKDISILHNIDTILGQHVHEHLDLKKLSYRVQFCQELGMNDELSKYLVKLFSFENIEKVFWIGDINTWVQGILNDSGNRPVIEKAIQFYKKIIDNDPDYKTLYIYSYLLYKDNQTELAMKYAELSKRSAVASNASTSEIDNLVILINRR